MAKFRDPDFDMTDPENKVGNQGTGRPQRNYKFVDGKISHTGLIKRYFFHERNFLLSGIACFIKYRYSEIIYYFVIITYF